MWADPKVLAGRTSIVSKVCRPVPLSEEIQQLERKKNMEIKKSVLKRVNKSMKH